mmetsp:Transcript_86492/g.218080  ORF Transcript_86492/g.218080 Transcript_86492/m.218080 type:complete len:316 (+) Transcript_86492:76-1023(+)
MSDHQLRHAVDHLHGLALRLVEPRTAEAVDDLLRAQPEAIGVDRDVLQAPEGAEGRPVKAVIDHEVVDEQAPSGFEGLVCVRVQVGNDRLRDRPRDVGHQHEFEVPILHWPRRAGGVELHEDDAALDVLRLLRLDGLCGAANLRQLKHRALEARRGTDEDVRKGTRTTSNVKHGSDAAQLQFFLHQVLRSGHGTIVLGLRVRLGDLRIREPRCIARSLAAGHDVRQGAHAMVELAADLEAQIISIEVPGRGHHVLRRVRRQEVHALWGPAQALHRGERSEQGLQPWRVDAAGLFDGLSGGAAFPGGSDVVENAEL